MLHIAEEWNAMTDIPSHLFGSKAKWHFTVDKHFLTCYDSLFLLPTQEYWNYFCIFSTVSTKVISILQAKNFKMGECQHLQKAGKHIGRTGERFSYFWEGSLTYRAHSTPNVAEYSLALSHLSSQEMLTEDFKSQLKQSLLQSWLLAR